MSWDRRNVGVTPHGAILGLALKKSAIPRAGGVVAGRISPHHFGGTDE
jgi:hypothetical protein